MCTSSWNVSFFLSLFLLHVVENKRKNLVSHQQLQRSVSSIVYIVKPDLFLFGCLNWEGNAKISDIMCWLFSPRKNCICMDLNNAHGIFKTDLHEWINQMNWQYYLHLIDLLENPLQWSLQGKSLIKTNMNMYVTLFLNYTHKSTWAPSLRAQESAGKFELQPQCLYR